MRRRGWRRAGSIFLSMGLTVGLIPAHAGVQMYLRAYMCIHVHTGADTDNAHIHVSVLLHVDGMCAGDGASGDYCVLTSVAPA